MDARHSLGEPRCLISRGALLHNVSKIRQAIGPGVKICAVVKAGAYGHDADIIVDTLCNFSHDRTVEPPVVDALAVADIDEAAGLPPTDLPVSILRPIENAYLGAQRARLEAAIHHGWTVTICSAAAADDLARIAIKRGQQARVQIMVNTGLNRAGVEMDDFSGLFEKIQRLPSLRLMGISSHFSNSEEPTSQYNADQLSRFMQACETIGKSDGPRPQRSAANSGAIFFLPESHLDMVRPGISLFGVDPTCKPNMDRPLRPVMRWTAPLIALRDVPVGSSVGYGQTWTATRPTKLGLLPIGYADGYPRAASNSGVMLIDGKIAPIAGRVSMDLTVIDLTEVPHVMVGDEVTVMDNDPLSPASVYRLAELAGTIPYELFCRIGSRVRRVAIDDFSPRVRPAGAEADKSLRE